MDSGEVALQGLGPCPSRCGMTLWTREGSHVFWREIGRVVQRGAQGRTRLPFAVAVAAHGRQKQRGEERAPQASRCHCQPPRPPPPLTQVRLSGAFCADHDALLLRLGLEPQLDTALGPTPLRRLTPGPSSSLCSQGGLATHPPNPQTVLDIILGDEEKVALPLSERPRSILPALYRRPSLIS